MCNNNILRFCLSVIGKSSRYSNKIDCHVQERTTCTFFILTMRVCNGVSKWKMTKVYNFIPLQLEILISILIIYCRSYCIIFLHFCGYIFVIPTNIFLHLIFSLNMAFLMSFFGFCRAQSDWRTKESMRGIYFIL